MQLCVRKDAPDARTQPVLPWEAAQIRTASLRLLPLSPLSLQEAKGSFPCLWESLDPSAPEQMLAEGGRTRASPAGEAALRVRVLGTCWVTESGLFISLEPQVPAL